jgi:glutamine amidotransferase
MGNLRSVAQAVIHAASVVDLCRSHRHVRSASGARRPRAVYARPGAMPDCMSELKASGLLKRYWMQATKKPLVRRVCGHANVAETTALEGRYTGYWV